jgi:hypothetical protein
MRRSGREHLLLVMRMLLRLLVVLLLLLREHRARIQNASLLHLCAVVVMGAGAMRHVVAVAVSRRRSVVVAGRAPAAS